MSASSREPSAGRVLHCQGIDLALGRRTLIMGVLNLTPDSFSSDGLAAWPSVGDASTDGFASIDPALVELRARQLIAEGADILDLGGESTRPGADEVSEAEEIRRVIPAIERLAPVARELGVPLSIDTMKASVALAALAAGASIVNDVTGLRGDPAMAGAAYRYRAPVIVMHLLGRPRTMQRNPIYTDLLGEIVASLRASLAIATAAGIPRSQVVIDPGIGFGKTIEHNLEIIRRLGELRVLGQPILIGTSRKSFIGRILGGLPPTERVEGTAATVVLAIANGADIVRVHDVRAVSRAARIADAVVRGYQPDRSQAAGS